jgi:hypothetical protein
MTWFWLNMPLAAVLFAAWTAIPLWLVLRHTDTGLSPQAPAGPSPGSGRLSCPAKSRGCRQRLCARRRYSPRPGTGGPPLVSRELRHYL